MDRMEAPIEVVAVSPEMTTLIGRGPIDASALPADAAAFVVSLGGMGARATLRVVADANAETLGDSADTITFVVMHAALDRVFDWSAAPYDGCSFHLTSEMRAMANSLRDCPRSGEAKRTYRLGKSLELICECIHAFQSDALVPVAVEGGMSASDSIRVVAARQLIDERWTEKLTLGLIARSCGINRAKLTRGFRELYRCSVTEAIAERRLAEARVKLLTTDLPVSTIGYASGYLNNASFTRAFGRRFGVSPSSFRDGRLAA